MNTSSMIPAVRKIVYTANAPGSTVAPFSQAIVADRFVYTSGCLGIDIDTEKLVAGGIIPEIRQIFKNLAAILEAANSNLNKVIKITIVLQNLRDFDAVNEEYRKVFTRSYPARSYFKVAKLPFGGLIEIEAVALVGDVQFIPSKL